MIGTGDLAPNLIKAHCSQRSIERVYIWGRSQEKARSVIKQLPELKVEFIVADSIDETIPKVDIISCATLSPTPLIKGELLQAGQHIDLVGSYKKDTREADDRTIMRSSIFVDTYEGGLTESGDILIPLETGIISRNDISADLIELSKNEHPGRTNENEITVFKSVGHASEDLIAANYYFNLHTHE
jgi:ornithine cyclodeaminase